MSEVLVSALLARLDEIEMAAQDSAGCRSGPWSLAQQQPQRWGDHDPDPEILAGGKPIARLDGEYGGYFHAVHAIAHDPPSVARLCRAHRDIIDMYVQAKAQPVAESVPHSKGRGLDHASAMGRLTTLGLVLQALARGLGVEETEGKEN